MVMFVGILELVFVVVVAVAGVVLVHVFAGSTVVLAVVVVLSAALKCARSSVEVSASGQYMKACRWV